MDRLSESDDVRVIGDIRGAGMQDRAAGRDDLLLGARQPLRVDVGQHQLGAACRGSQCRRAADPTRRACDAGQRLPRMFLMAMVVA